MTLPLTPTSADALDSSSERSIGGDRPRIYLCAGQFACAVQPTALLTILGSCIAVCVWDMELKLGGMNHFQLPNWDGRGHASPRFGNVAVGSLLTEVERLGGRPEQMRAKIFGGASVLTKKRCDQHLGLRNAELARTLLDEAGIPIVSEDVGGRRGRKLVFQTDDGTAWIKRL